MTYIIINPEQARVIAEANEDVQVRDESGNVLGYASSSGFTSEEIKQIKRDLASDQARYTTKEVLDHLRSLEQG